MVYGLPSARGVAPLPLPQGGAATPDNGAIETPLSSFHMAAGAASGGMEQAISASEIGGRRSTRIGLRGRRSRRARPMSCFGPALRLKGGLLVIASI
jgi:hypothetical protein